MKCIFTLFLFLLSSYIFQWQALFIVFVTFLKEALQVVRVTFYSQAPPLTLDVKGVRRKLMSNSMCTNNIWVLLFKLLISFNNFLSNDIDKNYTQKIMH